MTDSAFVDIEFDRAAYEATSAAQRAEAWKRLADAFRERGVSMADALSAVGTLEALGFEPRYESHLGVLTGIGMLDGYNPNGIRHDRLVLQQAWQPREDPPERPWFPCRPSEHNGWGTEACRDPEHGEHTRSGFNSWHRPSEEPTPHEVPD